MNKKEILKQLKKIKSLMECDIFYVDETWADYYKIGGNDEFNNDNMFSGICRAIELIEKKGDK
tara:strand:+ start:13 stop:201 length:189 start_codon:yes stop_codon:yes gene_type:complete